VPGHDIVVIGASAGGVEALESLVSQLPDDLGAALFVVMHFSAGSPSVLASILTSAGRVPAHQARHGEPIHPGHIYVARPDYHLTLTDGHVRVVRGPRENGHRPAIDALFRTAAHDHGRQTVGIVLSGALDDGTAGLVAIKRHGGIAVVQDPDDAIIQQMPRSAIDHVDVDHVLSAVEIGRILPRLVDSPPGATARVPDPVLDYEAALARNGKTEGTAKVGKPSAMICPDCGGVLNEIEDGKMVRFRCQVGHAFAPEALDRSQRLHVETALWAAVRALEERATLARRLAARARDLRHPKSERLYTGRADAAAAEAETVRQLLGLGAARDESD